MKCFDELKAEIERLGAEMLEAKMSEYTEALEKIKYLCNKSGFEVGMVPGDFAEGRKSK